MYFKKKHFIDSFDATNELKIKALEDKMEYFYKQRAIKEAYWEHAETVNNSWEPDRYPFHCDLISRIKDEETVIDFGCGSANFLVNSKKHIRYIGVELSDEQVAINRRKFPDAEFIVGDSTKKIIYPSSADWAISLYVLEHLARPHLLIQNMVKSLKPGGKLALICPNFIHGMNSIRSGFRATTKRTKLRKLQLLDFVYSLVDEKILIPNVVRSLHDSPMKFPVYQNPRCLDAPFFSDNDAIHLVNQDKIIDYIKSLDLTICAKAENISKDHSHSTLYIIAQK